MAAVLAAAVSKAVQEGERMIKRGDVYWADLQPTVGSEQGGVRPVMILQNDKGNYFSSTVIIAPMTAKTGSILFFRVMAAFLALSAFVFDAFNGAVVHVGDTVGE